jgi:hypothetical protein
MINLIPPTARKGVIAEYWIRVTSVWLILLAFALFAAAAISLPAYVLISSQVEEHESSAVEALQKVADYQNVTGALIEASQQAKLIVDEDNLPRFSTYVLMLQGLQEEGIQINTVNLKRDASGIVPIDVGGIAADRQTLASFRDRLLADESVVDVELPISNLARDKDIAFNLRVMLVNSDSI